jgi:pyruvate formate lyase activating enzyme
MEKKQADAFLAYLQSIGKRTWLRHVYIPTLNDNYHSIGKLIDVKNTHSCVERIELLPFRRLCLEKYHSMGIQFPLENTPEPTLEEIAALKSRFPDLY